MFQVVYWPMRRQWMHVDWPNAAETLYEGQIIYNQEAHDGAHGMTTASGAADTTNSKKVPFGVTVADNNRDKTYDSTYKVHSIASVATQAAQVARTSIGMEGATLPKGDPSAAVQVDVIGPMSMIKGPLYNGAVGTAPTLLTVTTGSTDGLSMTTNACDYTPIAYQSTVYCRTGLNAGISRVSWDTSTTARTFYKAWPYDIVIGDTFVSVPVRIGVNYAMQFDSEATYINVGADASSNYYVLNVYELNLETAGKEYCLFSFNVDHFALKRE